MIMVSDAPSCGATYIHHSEDIYALRATNYAPREHLQYSRQNIFTAQATEFIGLGLI
jgi:hypothetical protein